MRLSPSGLSFRGMRRRPALAGIAVALLQGCASVWPADDRDAPEADAASLLTAAAQAHGAAAFDRLNDVRRGEL